MSAGFARVQERNEAGTPVPGKEKKEIP